MFEPTVDRASYPPTAIVAVALVVLSFALAGASTWTETYPARWFMERQATWSGGTYGVKLTFLVTWFTLLAPLVGGLCAAVAVHTAWTLRGQPGPPPEAAEVVRRARTWGVAMGAALLLAGLGAAALVVEPTVLAPLGRAASWVLLVIPFGPLFGSLLLADGLVPPRLHEGVPAIEAPDERGTIWARVGGARFAVDRDQASAFAPSVPVRVVVSGILGRMLWRG